MDEHHQLEQPLAPGDTPGEGPQPGQESVLPEADYEWLQLALFPPGGSVRQHDVVLEPYEGRGPGVILALGVLITAFGAVTAAQARSDPVQQVVGTVVFLSGTAAVVRGLWVLRLRGRCSLPRLVLSVQPVYLGERFTVRFQQRFHRGCQLQHVILRLVCREEVRWRQGEEMLREREETYRVQQVVVPARDVAPGGLVTGQAEFTVPDQGMHSFSSPHNQVRWLLELEIAVAGREAYREQFPLLVAPRRVDT